MFQTEKSRNDFTQQPLMERGGPSIVGARLLVISCQLARALPASFMSCARSNPGGRTGFARMDLRFAPSTYLVTRMPRTSSDSNDSGARMGSHSDARNIF